MKLVASMIVRNEIDRYLRLVIPHLESFCDEIAVVDDGSTDGTFEYLVSRSGSGGKVRVVRNPEPVFTENEGIARQGLFEFTMEREPTHMLAIDADEFVSDGLLLRSIIADNPDVPVLSLLVAEVWTATTELLWLRIDGGWRPSYSPLCYRVDPAEIEADKLAWQIPPRKLACGREPYAVVRSFQDGLHMATPVQLLHFGWTHTTTRQERYERYAIADGGEFHANAHIESIVAKVGVQVESMEWPTGGLPKDAVLAHLL